MSHCRGQDRLEAEDESATLRLVMAKVENMVERGHKVYVLGYKGKWGPLSSHASWAMGPDLWLTPSTLLYCHADRMYRLVGCRKFPEVLAAIFN